MAAPAPTAPTAVHLGRDDLPFVDIGDGARLKVIHVDPELGLWIVENVFQTGFEVQRHRPAPAAVTASTSCATSPRCCRRP